MTDSTDNSIKPGISLPMWMKKQMESRYDFDQSAFSPPTHEEDFFYIKYPKSMQEMKQEETINQKKYHNLHDVLEDKGSALAKHTEPCKEYIPQIKVTPTVQPKVIKPMGTDDGFYGEGAACGKSVVAVAHHMLFKLNPKQKGFSVEDKSDELNPERYHRHRRNSKSLPASPLSSPPSTPNSSPVLRRKNPNKFFTGPFMTTEDSISEGESSPQKSGWIMSGMLKNQREAISTPSLVEESMKVFENQSPAGSVDSPKETQSAQRLTPATPDLNISVGVEVKQVTLEKHPVYKTRASELREMNFWSPTSM